MPHIQRSRPLFLGEMISLLLFLLLIILDVSLVPLSPVTAVAFGPSSVDSLRIRAGALDGSGGKEDEHDDDEQQEQSPSFESDPETTSAAVEEYVAAMKERDRQGIAEPEDDDIEDAEDEEDHEATSSSFNKEGEGFAEGESDESSSSSPPAQDELNNDNGDSRSTNNHNDADDSLVSVKAHSQKQKKSNAVGDPDGDDDDDDDDQGEEDALSELSEDWEELDEFSEKFVGDFVGEPQLQVEVDFLEDEAGTMVLSDDIITVGDDDQEDDEEEGAGPSTAKGGGGVGVQLSRMNNRRRNSNRRDAWRSPATNNKLSQDASRMMDAWMPHVYFPPTPPALAYLSDNARMLDASSKNRLDRRTLYAALLMEWGTADAKVSSNTRKFLPGSSSQALQAALSLATQPQWRQSAPRTSGIRLYQDEEAVRGCTLGMQETTAMALAHSLGCGMLILDDHVINKVRHQMASCGMSDEAIKPAALLQSLLNMAKQGKLKAGMNAGSISACMKRDLMLGLDDPYDDRAAISCDEMILWEEEWKKCAENDEKASESTDKPLPLLIFIRTNTSTNLLKSKSAMELLIQESTSNESIHLITLGRGIDATTASLPREAFPDHPQELQDASSRNMQGSAPWFGFSPQNQNASGQNDPEGSRRFNIFLARTIDQNGQPGILGAIAPPQAGNLFPHMMAMQARERLQNQDEDSPIRAELERWAQMLQQQMENNGSNGGMPMPPPQFFNASLAYSGTIEDGQLPPPPPPPEVIEQVLQQAMSELLDRLAQMSDDGDGAQSELSPDLQRAFAQVLRNDNLRRGIRENLARAAPALSDPKCQGVMLSVYVPPPPHHLNRGKLPGPPNGMQSRQPNNMGGWFQKILNNQEEYSEEGMDDESEQKNRQKRVRTMAAAAAVMAANKAKTSKGSEKASENKAVRNLAKLESICRPISIDTPRDPVRAKSWESWILRERGAVIFRQNRKILNEQLASRKLALQQHTGTRGAGSALRQMLSVRDISSDMEEVIKCAVELEAAKSQRIGETSQEMHDKEMNLDIDISLSQLVVADDGSEDEAVDSISVPSASEKANNKADGIQYIHPSSLEMALSMKCMLSPSPSGGGLSVASGPISHRSKDEIMALAQDKHERALVSQVVSPQDIGVTWDMVGGLSEVKELLRQSITYPLKFPHLYSEGIAREAVKGVLLFGPPGTGMLFIAFLFARERDTHTMQYARHVPS